MMKKLLLLALLLPLIACCVAQIPNGYYNGTENLSGTALQARLHNIIDDHDALSYAQVWNAFQTTDRKANGKVWDMYSDIPGSNPPYTYNFGGDQCGNYSGEGDCYNREHTFPQSWFNEQPPAKSDLFHLYPTDGYVNGRRSNYPMGNVGNATWTSENGCKLGHCSDNGYSGIVFEPIDEYKGDFARTFFYMAVRYYNEDGGWDNTDMTNGAQLKSWAMNTLQQWHLDDPVSQKEIDRNNAIYAIQGNRNPFIDCPSFVGRIWDGPAAQNITSDDCFSTPEICQAPQNISVTANQRNIHISWTATPTAQSYDIYVNNQLLDEDITTTNYDDNNLTDGTYCYYIIAHCDNETSDHSPTACETISLSISENNQNNTQIFPNPINNVLNVNTTTPCILTLYNVIGQPVIQRKSLQAEQIQLNTETLHNGIYILKVYDLNSGETNSYKIVK